nr:MAG TPA: hypothetical protein [Bacteriophage sp.]
MGVSAGCHGSGNQRQSGRAAYKPLPKENQERSY